MSFSDCPHKKNDIIGLLQKQRQNSMGPLMAWSHQDVAQWISSTYLSKTGDAVSLVTVFRAGPQTTVAGKLTTNTQASREYAQLQ